MGKNLKKNSTKKVYYSAHLSQSSKFRKRRKKKQSSKEKKQLERVDEVLLLEKKTDEERELVSLDCFEIIINNNTASNDSSPLPSVDFSKLQEYSCPNYFNLQYKQFKHDNSNVINVEHVEHLKDHDYDNSSIFTDVVHDTIENNNGDISEAIEMLETTDSGHVAVSNSYTDDSIVSSCIEQCNDSDRFRESEKQFNDLIKEINGVVNNPTESNEDVDETRYIIDMDFFMKEMHNSFDGHAVKNACLFKDWIWLKKKTKQLGLLTQFFFKCQNCKYESSIWSEPINDDRHMEINKAAVISSVAVGIGYSQLEKLLSGVNINAMSDKTFIYNKNDVLNNVENISLDIMKEAAEEEKRVAKGKGQVTKDGIPYIAVTVDGSWMKRSYGTNYNSPSGVGAIVGYYTGKVLFYSVRNKYCLVCERAENKGMKPAKHKCFKNWDSNAPSTGMESDAILEGFRQSVEMHGVIYKTIVTDGDSSIYKAIIDSNIYSQYDVVPERILCTNHLLRNLCKKLRTVSNTTQSRGEKRVADFVELRNVVKKNIGNVRESVEQSVTKRVAENKSWPEKVDALRQDILNIPMHVFGQHSKCTEIGCDCQPENEGERNYVPDLQRIGLYMKIEEAIQFLSMYSESLLHKMTNNAVESFNSIICVDIGGKRINWGLRNQYNLRIGMSVIQHNTQQTLTAIFERSGKKLPHVAVSLEKRRQEKVLRTKNAKKSQGKRKKKRLYIHGTKKYYGESCAKPDRFQKEIDKERDILFQKLKDNQENRETIERETVLQSQCSQWQTVRKNLLTASNFGIACRWQPHTSCAAKVKNILYPPRSLECNPAIMHGIEQERIAFDKLSKEQKLEVRKCGLFIDSKFEYLAASPDALLGADGIIEIKSPYGAANMTAEDAITHLKNVRYAFDKNDLNKMNKNHNHYYQIQGQLHIANKQYCLYVINTPYSMKSIRIERDDEFWFNKMEKQLSRFYMDCLLPEILDSRYNRHMTIRDPDYTLKAKQEIKNKKLMESITGTKSRKRTFADAKSVDDSCECTGSFQIMELSEHHKRISRTYFDSREFDLTELETRILNVNQELNTDCIDCFIRVVNYYEVPYEIQSAHYLQSVQCIEPVNTPSIQILGGVTRHWRTVYYDGSHLYVYDSLATFGPLREAERSYVRARYPTVTDEQIVYKRMRTYQPDLVSCGIYACAVLLSIVLDEDPSITEYSLNVKKMREHFVRIINSQELLPFPKINGEA